MVNRILRLGTSWGTSPFDLDGTPVSSNATTGSMVMPAFSNVYSNGIVYMAAITNGGSVTSVTSSGLTWTRRASVTSSSEVELWSAKSASALSAHVVTVNLASSAFTTCCVFSFSGALYATPYDTNGNIPKTAAGSVTLPITTTNLNDILIAVRLSAGSEGSAATAPAAFTLINSTNFLSVQYAIVAAAQTGTVMSGGTWGDSGAIADAIMKA